jgi:hypothetical protein
VRFFVRRQPPFIINEDAAMAAQYVDVLQILLF